MKRVCEFLFCLLLISACTTGSQSPGSAKPSPAEPSASSADINPVADLPEIAVSKTVITGYQAYLSWFNPLAFAVSQDGQHFGYRYCSYTCNIKLEEAEAAAISECNGPSGAVRKCSIFAVGRKDPRKYKLANASKHNTIILSDQDEVVITPEVAQEYAQCDREMNPLAFAVSSDGQTSYCLYCEAMACLRPTQYASEAVVGCNDRYATKFGTHDGHCVVFSIGRAKPRKYRVAAQ